MGFSLLHSISLARHEQGTVFHIPIPNSIPTLSATRKHKHRRRVLACRLDAETGVLDAVQKNQQNACTNRRAMLAVFAFSACPFLAPPSHASGDPVNIYRKEAGLPVASRSQKLESVDATSPSQQQTAKAEFKDESESQGSNFFGFFNQLGIIGSGVLGALYMLEQKDKAATGSQFEALKIELKENEVALSSLRENLEERILLEQEKNLRQAQKAQEEQAFLSNELNSAKHTVENMQKQVERQNKMVEEFEEQVERLNADITQVQNDNRTLELELKEKDNKINDLEDNVRLAIANKQEKEKELESLIFSLREREKESAELSSKVEQMRKSLLQAEAQIKEFQQELESAQKELRLKESSIENLSERLASAVVEREDNKEKLVKLHQELNETKLKSDKDLVSARQAIFAKQAEVNQLKEKLNIAYEEAKKKDGILTGLQEESSALKSLLEEEKTNVKHLSSELQRSIESLEALQSKVVTLSSELTTAKRVQAQLESEIARLENDRDAMRDSLEEKVHEAEQTSSKLSSELASVNKALDTARNDLLLLRKKLEDSRVSYENINEELSEARKTAVTTSAALNEEKKAVAALSRELEASKKILLEEKEGRRALHRDFEEVTKSMEDMRICLVSLSEELEIAKSKSSSLETENASLYESLKQEKHLSKEIQESAGHANKILMKLGKEKETYVKKARKLEEELSSAKGEILRLRKQLTVKNTALEEAQQQKDKEIKSKQSHDSDRSPMDVSQQIESMQAELSQIQKKFGDVDQERVESAVRTNSLHELVNREKPPQDTARVAPVSAHDKD